MIKEVISIKGAPEAIGMYSQGIRIGNVIYTSGQIPLDPKTGNLISGGTPISGFTDEVRYLGHGRIDLQWLGLEKSQYLPVSLVLIAIVYIIFWICNHQDVIKIFCCRSN